MKYSKIFICVSLLFFCFSCYAQDTTSTFRENITSTTTYTHLSNLLHLKKMGKVVEALQETPMLASSLTLKQIEGIGWKNWIIINTHITNQMSLNQPPETITPLEIDTWIESLDKNIVIKLLENRLKIALMNELESDWYDWNESKEQLSQKQREKFQDKVEEKIKYLTNQEDKKAVIALFKNAKLEINIIEK